MIVGTKFDVDDIEKYKYLDPLWKVLESVPSDQKITMEEAGKKSGLDPAIGVPLIEQLSIEFQQKMMKNMLSLLLPGSKKQMTQSWTFDKIMLLTKKVNTGSDPTKDIDPELMKQGKPILKDWEDSWREKRGT